MKTTTICIACAISACVSLASQDVPTGEANSELAAKRAEAHERMLKKTGGIVERKGTGKIVFINCQSLIDDKEIAKRVEKIAYVLKFTCETRRGEWTLGAPLPSDANIAIYIVDNKSLPMSLVAVESRWALINTSSLGIGARFSRELTRVFSLVAGGAVSQVPTSPMQPVFKPEDLDKLLTDGFTFDMANSISRNTPKLGVTPSIRASYRKACQEGWAPAPTNEYQKAVWDKVHEMPTEPIKIKPEARKVQQ